MRLPRCKPGVLFQAKLEEPPPIVDPVFLFERALPARPPPSPKLAELLLNSIVEVAFVARFLTKPDHLGQLRSVEVPTW